jgi:predicted dithiol-disulfide oxidoreductase (DUF899 family)
LIIAHLAQRDTAFVAVSRAPLEKLEARKRKMGWTFPWVSSGDSDFNYDFAVSFRDEDMKAGTATYNYAPKQGAMNELPGISAFVKGDDGSVYHTYSCFASFAVRVNRMRTASETVDPYSPGRPSPALSRRRRSGSAPFTAMPNSPLWRAA